MFDNEIIVDYKITSNDIIRLLENFSGNSIYSVQSEINNGYLTIKGGHRIGIAGTCIFDGDRIRNIKYISSLNIRIAREVKNCSVKILDKIVKNSFENTLIISPPGCGKTTLLRDMVRLLSNGYGFLKGFTVALIDERSEIAAMYNGIPQNDIGIRTDVMNNCEKGEGIRLMVRSMGPDIVSTDEIGSKNDIDAIFAAITSGVRLLLTAHGESIDDLPTEILRRKIFTNIIVLKKAMLPGTVEKICILEDDKYVICS